MNVSATTAAPAGFPPGLPAELAAAVLWFVAKLAPLVRWRMTWHPRAACAMEAANFLTGAAQRFARVMARLAAGEVFRARPSRAGVVRKAPASPRVRLPMAYGWMGRLGEDVRLTAAIIGYHLNRRGVPEMIAACPQARRVLRPMCHMLGIDAPCVGRVVRRRRVAVEAAGALPAPDEDLMPARAGAERRRDPVHAEAAPSPRPCPAKPGQGAPAPQKPVPG